MMTLIASMSVITIFNEGKTASSWNMCARIFILFYYYFVPKVLVLLVYNTQLIGDP